MSNFIDRVVMAYRPLYLRGLLMDGQYRLPLAQEQKPEKGDRVVHATPAFNPQSKRKLVLAASFRAPTNDEPSSGLSGV